MTMSATVADDASGSWLTAVSRSEIDRLLELDDVRSWRSIAVNWGLIAASFALVAIRPHPFTVIVAICVIGARQLGLAILMHDAAHRVLLRDRAWNDWVGNWLCAFPVWGDLRPYRRYHLQHHAKTGTPEDPDLGLAAPFPVTRASMRRKIWRDLSGRTGVKRARATFRRDLGLYKGRSARQGDAGVLALHGVIITNAIMLTVLALLGHPALYLLWVAAWLTTYSLAMRIRSIAEHGMVPDLADPLGNTRTTLARWWERLLVAPNFVNYHLEHHLLMTVPHYNLPAMHRLLRERRVLDRACVTDGYLEVLRLASSRAAGGATVASGQEDRPPF